jgi:hypothetical protein
MIAPRVEAGQSVMALADHLIHHPDKRYRHIFLSLATPRFWPPYRTLTPKKTITGGWGRFLQGRPSPVFLSFLACRQPRELGAQSSYLTN